MMRKLLIVFTAALILSASCAQAYETREDLRKAYNAISAVVGDSLYIQEASVSDEYSVSVLTDTAKRNALDTVNFLRAVANLNPVSENELYDLRCAHAAVLLAANDYVDHDPPKPDAMPDEFYETAHSGTSQSNLVGLNWMRPTILTEENSGMTFTFDCRNENGDGYCRMSEENFGAGVCIIFRPDFGGTDFTDYCQNQRWTVRITGLCGEKDVLEYTVKMESLYVQEVSNVELSVNELQMRKGETAVLYANVIPEYADDLTVSWSSGDENIASVDANGKVTALSEGECSITARTANGREDLCRITITE